MEVTKWLKPSVSVRTGSGWLAKPQGSQLTAFWRLGSNHLDAAVRLRQGHESCGLMRAIGLEDDLAISDRPPAVAVP